MAAKYQLITELYRRTGVAVAKNPQAWQGFLSSACRNYKCRFDEQLLIYAQRPDAVAVAKLETWNRQFRRWVNKDSKGIAVFDPKGRRNTLKYYFDVSESLSKQPDRIAHPSAISEQGGCRNSPRGCRTHQNSISAYSCDLSSQIRQYPCCPY